MLDIYLSPTPLQFNSSMFDVETSGRADPGGERIEVLPKPPLSKTAQVSRALTMDIVVQQFNGAVLG